MTSDKDIKTKRVANTVIIIFFVILMCSFIFVSINIANSSKNISDDIASVSSSIIDNMEEIEETSTKDIEETSPKDIEQTIGYIEKMISIQQQSSYQDILVLLYTFLSTLLLSIGAVYLKKIIDQNDSINQIKNEITIDKIKIEKELEFVQSNITRIENSSKQIAKNEKDIENQFKSIQKLKTVLQDHETNLSNNRTITLYITHFEIAIQALIASIIVYNENNNASKFWLRFTSSFFSIKSEFNKFLSVADDETLIIVNNLLREISRYLDHFVNIIDEEKTFYDKKQIKKDFSDKLTTMLQTIERKI